MLALGGIVVRPTSTVKEAEQEPTAAAMTLSSGLSSGGD